MTEAALPPLERAAAAVFAQATWRAARRLGFSRKTLAVRLGLSPAQALGLATGGYPLRSDTSAGRTAAQIIRLFLALDGLVGGDATTRLAWMNNWNRHLRGVPRALINTEAGLAQVLEYLEALHVGR